MSNVNTHNTNTNVSNANDTRVNDMPADITSTTTNNPIFRMISTIPHKVSVPTSGNTVHDSKHTDNGKVLSKTHNTNQARSSGKPTSVGRQTPKQLPKTGDTSTLLGALMSMAGLSLAKRKKQSQG